MAKEIVFDRVERRAIDRIMSDIGRNSQLINQALEVFFEQMLAATPKVRFHEGSEVRYI
jgi:hypothetical protein